MIEFTNEDMADLERLTTLSEREQEVFDSVMRGNPNKVIAIDLDCSQRTIEIHRAKISEKLMPQEIHGMRKHTSYVMARYLPLLTKAHILRTNRNYNPEIYDLFWGSESDK